MNLVERIPKEFYKLFASKYTGNYQQFLTAIYEESGRSSSLLGLTERECRAIINEQIAAKKMDWGGESIDEEGEPLTRANMAAAFLKNLEDWGWLRRDYDESLDSYVVSFPEYSQLFAELFCRLYSEEPSRERESVLAVYSYLHTYSADSEKNTEILKSALLASKSLLQMLANMQEGMRAYFDELSRQQSFLGIQQVLVKEINNSDSRKYAILTTTDSFYRYKEAVKELIDRNLMENESRKQAYLEEERLLDLEPGERGGHEMRKRALSRMISQCEEAVRLICLIEREFDAIERRYNKLIEQKTVFASRAAARIRYILLEGAMEEDTAAALVKLLGQSERRQEILERLTERMGLTERFRIMTDDSLYRRKHVEREQFAPQALIQSEENEALEEYILKPLYTRQELAAFRERNEVGGVFAVTGDAVQSVEDLEKLFFIWQEAAEAFDGGAEISVGPEFESPQGFRFSELKIKE